MFTSRKLRMSYYCHVIIYTSKYSRINSISIPGARGVRF